MTTGVVASPPILQFTLNNGQLAVNGSILTQIGGVNAATYSDSGLTTPLPNPIPLNSRGEISDAAGNSKQLFLTPNQTYTFTLFDGPNGTGNQIWQATYVNGVQLSGSTAAAALNTITNVAILNSYLQTASESSAGVTPTNYSYQPGNVLRYGADPSGTANSNSAFVAATASGYCAYAPKGTYKVSSGVTLTAGGIIGDGSYLTYITTSDTGTNDVFLYTGTFAARFENFSLQPVTTKSGGFGIVVGPASGEVSGMRFFQVVFNAIPSCINFVAASLYSVIGCNFYGFTGDAIKVNNTNNADSGDSTIEGCVLTSPGNTACNGIHQIESGGLRVVGNKFNDVGVGYLLDLGASSTSDLLITANSFENAHFTGIQLQRTAGAATFANVVITGNQFLIASSSGNSGGIFSNNGSAFLSDMAIAGNTFTVADLGAPTCIQLDYVSNAIIIGNSMVGAGAGTNTQGILLGTHNTNVKIGPNAITGFKFSANYPTGTNVVASDFQTGTTNVTTSSALGSLFSGQVTITFPTAFCGDAIPTLQNCSATVTSTTGGGICAQAVSVTATQLVINVIGVTNGGSVPIQWSAGGVI